MNYNSILSEERTVFIFPSEIAAASRREQALSTGKRKAVRSDRFISWDRFKEDAFALSRADRPVNGIHRLLFLSSLLGKNENTSPGFFRYLIHNDFRGFSGNLTRSCASMLPGLKKFLSVIQEGREGGIDPGLLHDLTLLYREYTDFLRANGLFEPNYEQFTLAPYTKPGVIFFPEIIQDFQMFRPEISRTPGIRVISAGETGEVSFRFFPNALQEVKDVVHSLEVLLEQNTDPSDIAVTFADRDILLLVEHEAELRGMIFDLRAGAPLCDQPAGRLFTLLHQVLSREFNIETMKNLVLNRRFPWRARTLWEQMISFGVRQHCIRGRNIWNERLRRYGDTSLGTRFRTFAGLLERIVNAPSFEVLKQQFMIFTGEFFNPEAWEPEDLNVLQTCILILSKCVAAEKSMTGLGRVKPFQLYLNILSSHVYVQRGTGRGIPLYPYRVSAGIVCKHHFVIGVSEETVSVQTSPFPYLRDDQKNLLGLPDIDQTEPFLTVYAVSGSGVRFSGARETRTGTRIIPSYFIMRDRVRLVEETDTVPDLFEKERLFWATRADNNFPERLLPVQNLGFDYGKRTVLVERGCDATEERIRLPGHGSTGVPVRITPTGLEEYAVCPFSYLFHSLLGIDEEQYTPRLTDPKREGVLYHSVLSSLFLFVQERTGVVGHGDGKELLEVLNGYIREQLSSWCARGEVYLPPVLTVFEAKVKELLSAFLDNELATYPDFRVEAVEKELTREYTDRGFVLKGRIDRVSRSNGRFLLVDYKKRNRVTRNDMLGEDPVSFQMPFYYHLARENGMDVCFLSYYDIERSRFIHVLHPSASRAWTDPEGMEEMAASVVRAAENMAEGVREGRFTVPDDDRGCTHCRYRMVCRERYVVR